LDYPDNMPPTFLKMHTNLIVKKKKKKKPHENLRPRKLWTFLMKKSLRQQTKATFLIRKVKVFLVSFICYL